MSLTFPFVTSSLCSWASNWLLLIETGRKHALHVLQIPLFIIWCSVNSCLQLWLFPQILNCFPNWLRSLSRNILLSACCNTLASKCLIFDWLFHLYHPLNSDYSPSSVNFLQSFSFCFSIKFLIKYTNFIFSFFSFTVIKWCSAFNTFGLLIFNICMSIQTCSPTSALLLVSKRCRVSLLTQFALAFVCYAALRVMDELALFLISTISRVGSIFQIFYDFIWK